MKMAMTEEEHFFDIKDISREWVEEHASRPVHIVLRHECTGCVGTLMYVGKEGHVTSRLEAITLPLAAAHSTATATIAAQPRLASSNDLGFILLAGPSIRCATAASALQHLESGGVPLGTSLAEEPHDIVSVMKWLEASYDGTSQKIYDLLVSLPADKGLKLLKKIIQFDIGVRDPDKFIGEVLIDRE